MQKLTTPILIFLLLTVPLSAEDDREILMDKEILYWRPQGADIILPEIFYSPPLEFYPYGAWKTSLVPVLALPGESQSTESGETEELSFTAPDWQPPGLSLNGERDRRRNMIRLYASKPYGIGFQALGDFENFGYEIEGNGAVDDDYPHWGRLTLEGSPGDFSLKTVAGLRRDDDLRFLTLLEGDVSFGNEEADQSLGLRWKSDSLEIDTGPGEGSWGVLGGYRTTLFPGRTELDAGIEGEYLSDMTFNAYRLSPGLSLKHTLGLSHGDLVLKGGLLADLYPDTLTDSAFFPSLMLSYLKYDDFSLSLKYANETIDDETLMGFLLTEPSVAGDFGFYRWHRSSLSWAGRLGDGRASLEGGVRVGDMPRLSDDALSADEAVVLFTEAEWTLSSEKGIVTEFTLYADYEDTGSLRFLLCSGWTFIRSGGRVYELTLRGGDRLIVKGYEALLGDSSDILTGAGGGVSFSPVLKLEGNLDYVPRKGCWEGDLSLVCRY